MSIYPLPMRFPVPMDGSNGRKAREEGRGLRVGEFIDVEIRSDGVWGWEFMTLGDRLTFEALPVADRLEYRKAFEQQVALAKATPV